MVRVGIPNPYTTSSAQANVRLEGAQPRIWARTGSILFDLEFLARKFDLEFRLFRSPRHTLLCYRLPPNDRPRFRTYCHQLLAATTTLGVARVIRACLPIRCDSSNRVLPTPGDAIPSNGLPPRPPAGQYHPQLPSHRTTLLSPNRAIRPSDSTESPSPP